MQNLEAMTGGLNGYYETEAKVNFDNLIKTCKNITHEQAYDAFIKSRDTFKFEEKTFEFGDRDIIISGFMSPITGGRRLLRLNQ